MASTTELETVVRRMALQVESITLQTMAEFREDARALDRVRWTTEVMRGQTPKKKKADVCYYIKTRASEFWRSTESFIDVMRRSMLDWNVLKDRNELLAMLTGLLAKLWWVMRLNQGVSMHHKFE